MGLAFLVQGKNVVEGKRFWGRGNLTEVNRLRRLKLVK